MINEKESPLDSGKSSGANEILQDKNTDVIKNTKLDIEKNSGKRILVAATPLTLKEEKFHDLLCRTDHSHIVDPMPAPELVTFAENFMFDKSVIVSYLKDKMKNLKIDEYGTVVLSYGNGPESMKEIAKMLFKTEK